VYTGLTLRGIIVFNHGSHGIIERKSVFGFVAIKTEGLRACAEELVEKIYLHRRAQIVLTNRKLVLLNVVQDVFVRAAGELKLGVFRAKAIAHCHCQFDRIRAAVLMLLSAEMTLPAV
jgi:redox-regulated HSP33 family molecular chaperone